MLAKTSIKRRLVLSDKSKLLSYLEQPVFTDGQVPYHATPKSLLDFFTGKILA